MRDEAAAIAEMVTAAEVAIAEHPAEGLWNQQHGVAPYPSGVAPIRSMIQGTAFAPGGPGLWWPDSTKPLPPWPAGGVMVLGHNFDSVRGYESSLARRRESVDAGTWRGLVPLLLQADVALEECYFTNVFVGLIDGQSSVGKFPGVLDKAFTLRCLDFLVLQLTALRPRAILALGLHVPRLLARLSPGDLAGWKRRVSFIELDRSRRCLVRDVAFPMVPGLRCDVAALTHPSFSHVYRKRRRFAGREGAAAEEHLIRDSGASRPR